MFRLAEHHVARDVRLDFVKQFLRRPHRRGFLHRFGLGEKDRAFEWLEKAYEERSDLLVYLKVEPRLDSLRGDPRFADLLRRMRL